MFTFVLYYFAQWLVGKTCASFSSNERQNQSHSMTTCMCAFSHSLGWLCILIGSLHYLCLLWLVRVITLVLFWFFDTRLKTTPGVLNLIIIHVWYVKPNFGIKTRNTSFSKLFISFFMYSPATIKQWTTNNQRMPIIQFYNLFFSQLLWAPCGGIMSTK